MSNNIDIKFDKAFRKIDELYWLPWVGKDYTNSPQGKRLLIVGESHYVPDGESATDGYSDKGWTRNFISKEGLKQTPFYKGQPTNNLVGNLERVIFNKQHPTDEEKFKLWHSSAYFNIIQTLLGDILVRPDHEMKLIGRQVFFKVLEILKPDYCLIGGVGISNYVSNPDEIHDIAGYKTEGIENLGRISRTISRITKLESSSGHKIKLVFVRHPSRYFSWGKWVEFIEQQMGGYTEWLKGQ
jgi:hypothetical protein